MNTFFKKFLTKLDKPLFGLSFYYLLSVILLFNQCGTSFVDDSLEWIVEFKKYGWGGFWHSYEMTSVYWFHDFFSNILFLVFGKNNHAWFYIILSFHSSASYFAFKFFNNVFIENKRDMGKWIAFLSSLIFLFGAYNTENLFWIATYHYEVTILYLFVCLYKISAAKGHLHKKIKLEILIPFPFMLTMHEISFFFPFAFIATIIYFRCLEVRIRKIILEIVNFSIPYGIFSIALLCATKLIKGSFIPHYGISHVKDHSLYGFLYTFYNYCIKHIIFIHNFSFQIREKFYDVNSNSMYLFFTICFICFALFLLKYRDKLIQFKDYFFILFLMLLFYLPVSNMYFYWHFPIQNDRLGYFMSIFLYSFIVLFLLENFRQAGITLACIFLLLNFIVFRLNIKKLEESIYFTENIAIPSYAKYLDQNPIILNLPYNYNGFYSFRKIFRFKSSIYFEYDKNVNFKYVASMPFFRKTDSISIVKQSDSVIRIFNQAPGGWLMKEAVGGLDYENKEVKVDFDDDNQSATVYLKNYNKNQPILYCTGSSGFVDLK